MPIEARAHDMTVGSSLNASVPKIWHFDQTQSSTGRDLPKQFLPYQSLVVGEYLGKNTEQITNLLRKSIAASGPFFNTDLFLTELLIANKKSMAELVRDVIQGHAPRNVEAVFDSIINALIDEAIEDGYIHPAESQLMDVLRNNGATARHYLASLIAKNDLPSSVVSGLICLLGRQRAEDVPSIWFVEIIRNALLSLDIKVRDAAVQAVELLEDPTALDLLAKHKEPCTWLAEYISRVLRDLKD